MALGNPVFSRFLKCHSFRKSLLSTDPLSPVFHANIKSPDAIMNQITGSFKKLQQLADESLFNNRLVMQLWLIRAL